MDASRADAKSNYARASVLLATGVLSGIAIWPFSPQLTGQVEPWDADAPIRPPSWLLIAVPGGLVGHLRVWAFVTAIPVLIQVIRAAARSAWRDRTRTLCVMII
jgi:hypothetical protein